MKKILLTSIIVISNVYASEPECDYSTFFNHTNPEIEKRQEDFKHKYPLDYILQEVYRAIAKGDLDRVNKIVCLFKSMKYEYMITQYKYLFDRTTLIIASMYNQTEIVNYLIKNKNEKIV